MIIATARLDCCNNLVCRWSTPLNDAVSTCVFFYLPKHFYLHWVPVEPLTETLFLAYNAKNE